MEMQFLCPEKLASLRAAIGPSPPDSRLRSELIRASGDLNLAASRLLSESRSPSPIQLAQDTREEKSKEHSCVEDWKSRKKQNSETRRKAWRKFYLEQYRGAVGSVGPNKASIDAYITKLWKSIGSSGREKYVGAVSNTSDVRVNAATSSASREGKNQAPQHGTGLVRDENSYATQAAASGERGKMDVDPVTDVRSPSTGQCINLAVGCRQDVRDKERGYTCWHPGRPPWPRQIASRLCRGVMLVSGKGILTNDEEISLSVPPIRKSKPSRKSALPVVRLVKAGREVGRLDSQVGSLLGPAMQSGFLDVACRVVSTPQAVRMFSEVFVDVCFFLLKEVFDGEPKAVHNAETDIRSTAARRMSVVRMISGLKLCQAVAQPSSLDCNAVTGTRTDDDIVSESNVESIVNTVEKISAADVREQVSPRALASTLREYQMAGVRWMLDREKNGKLTRSSSKAVVEELHPMWQRCAFLDGEKFFMNTTTGYFSLSTPSVSGGGPYGGILADEMGLGKTVQCIACILLDYEEQATTKDSTNSLEFRRPRQWDPAVSSEISRPESQRSAASYEPPLDAVQHGASDDEWFESPGDVNQKPRKQRRTNYRGSTASAVSILMARAKAKSVREGGTLIVCPTSLVSQWMDELSFHVKPRFLRAVAHYGTSRGDVQSICTEAAEVVVTTYGVLSSEASGIESRQEAEAHSDGPLFQLQWRRVILDEAHTIKSRTTRWAKAAYRIDAVRRWCVTGTVVHNHVNDVFSLLHFLRVEPWSSWEYWNRIVVSNLESPDVTSRDAAMSLVRDVISSVTLRRKKSTRDARGLPIIRLSKKTVDIVSLTQSPEEKDFYTALHEKTKVRFDAFLAQGNVMKNYASVLELLLRLRQACDHPYLVFAAPSKDAVSMTSKTKLLKRFLDAGSPATYIEQVFQESQSGDVSSRECPVCLDIVDDAVALRQCGHPSCRSCLTEAVKRSNKCPVCRISASVENITTLPRDSRFSVNIRSRWRPSAKIDALLKDVSERQALREQAAAAVGKTVIFSQFTSMLDLVEFALDSAKVKSLRIDGSVPQARRAQILKQLDSERELSSGAHNVLLVSLRAGGVGLNLVACSFAILLDIHWNPQVDAQAQDRIHRHGQTRDVIVKRYIIKDSVEEKLLQVQRRKELLAEGTLEATTDEEKTQARLSELRLLFSA